MTNKQTKKNEREIILSKEQQRKYDFTDKKIDR